MSFGLLQENFAAIIALLLSALKATAHRTSLFFLRPGKKMVGISDLPLEVLAEIFTYVPIKDHVALSEVCRTFYAASKIELIWMARCRREFNVNIVGHDFSCKDFYTKVLYKYGSVIGLWQPEISSYGGLLQVELDNGRLVGSELFPPLDSNVKDPLRKKTRFILQLDEDKNVKVQCVGVNKNHHGGKITKWHRNVFSFKCYDKDAHACKHQGLIEWLNEEAAITIADTFPQRQELLLMKYLVMCQYNYSYRYNRVFLPSPATNVPIQPGLFKGTYGAHGLELIMLDYDEDGLTAKAVKVSGDPNVPSGKVTFMAELNYSMVLTVEDQSSISTLEMCVPTKTDYDEKRLASQPFRVPQDCHERYKDLPKTCNGRFFGTGQVAGHGFTNPSFTNGHWIIYDEDSFGFLWLELLSLSMYHRVKENLIQ